MCQNLSTKHLAVLGPLRQLRRSNDARRNQQKKVLQACPVALSMTVHGWLTLAACAGELALALLALLRGAPSRLALVFALFSLDLFFWNFATLAYEISGTPAWHWLDHATSPLSAPLALHFVLVFVGRRRQLRVVIALAYGAFGLISFASSLAFVSAAPRAFTESASWAVAYLALLVPVVLLGVACLIVHMRRSSAGGEQARARLLLAGFASLAVLGSTELVGAMGVPVPGLGNIGVLACNAMMAVGALRFRLFERPLRSALVWNALCLGVLTLGAYVAIFRFRGTPVAMLVLGVGTVLFAFAGALLQVKSSLAIRRERLQRMATLGRFSSQMAHDLKNPLAALKGAAQYLIEERRLGKPISEETDLVKLMLEQVDRLTGVVDRYQRIASVEPEFAPVEVNELVREVLALQPFTSAGERISLDAQLDAQLPRCVADRQLLSGALENLVRNAFEAMPNGGRLTVRTRCDSDDRLIIAVEDTGHGMNPRVLERAFEDFFTTKAHGTGLGLTFARRVAQAHGGDVLLTSREGFGTVVSLEIPLRVSAI
jgi:signal transduction histidine kinase